MNDRYPRSVHTWLDGTRCGAIPAILTTLNRSGLRGCDGGARKVTCDTRDFPTTHEARVASAGSCRPGFGWPYPDLSDWLGGHFTLSSDPPKSIADRIPDRTELRA